MSVTIYRFDAKDKSPFITITMPLGAEILAVKQSDRIPGEGITIWAEVDPEEKQNEARFFILMGTGSPNPWPEEIERLKRNYLATYQSINFGLIWHVYEVWPTP